MIEIDIKLIKDIEEYCLINDIQNPSNYVTKLLKKAFMEEKYGKKPDIFNTQEKENPSIKQTYPIETNIKEEKVNFVEEACKLSSEEDTKQQITEEIEKQKKSKKRKLS